MIELLGAEKCHRDLQGVSLRLSDTSVVMRHEMHMLEATEAGVFAGLHGRYINTGETLRSLTLPGAPDAIRRVTAHGLEFGTSVYYARYLTEQIGPPTPQGGMQRPPPVAVLKLDEITREQVARDTLNYVVGEGADSGLGTAFLGGML